MAIKIAFTNIKGGVSKSTSAVALSTELAMKGNKVLLVDADPQGNASSNLGVRDVADYSLSHVLEGVVDVQSVIKRTESNENLFVIPSNLSLQKTERKLFTQGLFKSIKDIVKGLGSDSEIIDVVEERMIGNTLERPDFVLSKVIDRIEGQYDYIIFDCSPYDNILVTNVFVATQYLIVPVKLDKNSMEGYDYLLEKVRNVREDNRSLEILGILPTMYRRTNLHDMVLEDLRSTPRFKELLFDTHIRMSIKVEESPFFDESVVSCYKKASASKDYKSFAEEVVNRVNK